MQGNKLLGTEPQPGVVVTTQEMNRPMGAEYEMILVTFNYLKHCGDTVTSHLTNRFSVSQDSEEKELTSELESETDLLSVMQVK